jgi:hypothetical protein
VLALIRQALTQGQQEELIAPSLWE